MKITWTRLKGVCLLLLGLATAGHGRSFAADIDTESFAQLAQSSSATTAGKLTTNPFKDETGSMPAKTMLVEPTAPLPGSAPCGACDAASCGACVANCGDDFCGAPGRIWFRGEYVHMWTSGAHLPPLVSTLVPTTNGDVPSTLFGDQTVYNGDHDGYRVSLGAWIDCKHLWGVEGDYFDVSGRPTNYDSGFTDGYSNGNAFTTVRIVFDPTVVNGNPLGLQPDYIGLAGNVNGRLTVTTNDYFQTAGLTLRRQLKASEWSTCNSDVNWTDSSARTFRLDAIGGYRFARLIDTVDEQDDSFVFNSQQATFGYDYTYVNNYRSVNVFNGCELGLNAVYTTGRWSLDVVGKAAIGVNNEFVSLYNQQTTDISNNVGVGTAPIQSNPNPLQEFSRNKFSAIPELTVTAGYQVTDHFKVTVGYDLLYWTAVVRAADQIAVEPTTGFPYGTVVGNFTNLPSFTYNESHYFAEGLRLGGELRF